MHLISEYPSAMGTVGYGSSELNLWKLYESPQGQVTM